MFQSVCAIVCNLFGSQLNWLPAGYVVVIVPYKSKVAESSCHFAVRLLSCINYVTIYVGKLVNLYAIIKPADFFHQY